MKKILITGTSRGIGKDLADYFLSDGFFVYGVSRSESSIGHNHYHHFQGDLSHDNFRDELCHELKILNIESFIHAAMYAPKHRPFLRVNKNDMNLCYSLAVIAPTEIIKSIYSSLKKHKGEIILLGSEIVHTGSSGQLPYLCAKSAMTGLTKGLSLELHKSEVTIKTLALVAVETETFLNNTSVEKKKELLERLPGGHFLTTDRIYEYIKNNKNKNNGEVITLSSKD